MRKRNKRSSEELKTDEAGSSSSNAEEASGAAAMPRLRSANRSSFVMLTIFALIMYASWSVYHYQFEVLPVPLSAEKAGKRGFSEIEAMKHVKELTDLGPHSVGSDALDVALEVSFLLYHFHCLKLPLVCSYCHLQCDLILIIMRENISKYWRHDRKLTKIKQKVNQISTGLPCYP